MSENTELNHEGKQLALALAMEFANVGKEWTPEGFPYTAMNIMLNALTINMVWIMKVIPDESRKEFILNVAKNLSDNLKNMRKLEAKEV